MLEPWDVGHARSRVEHHGIVRLDSEGDGLTSIHTATVGLLGHAVAAVHGLNPRSLINEEFAQMKTIFERVRRDCAAAESLYRSYATNR